MKQNKILTAGITLLLLGSLVATSLVFAKENGKGNGNENKSDKESKQQDNKIGPPIPKVSAEIKDNGNVLVRGAKITNITSNIINASVNWGSIAMNWIINTDNSTELIRLSNGQSSLGEFSIGDIISFQGNLTGIQTNQPVVNAKTVKNWSIRKQQAGFTGNVTNINTSSSNFTIETDNELAISVSTTNSTVITKGTSTVSFGEIKIGDKVLVQGIYDVQNQTLTANNVKIYTNSLISKNIFEGTMTALASTTLPTTFGINIQNTNYNVNVPVGISILNRNWAITPFSNFQVGDHIRIYGSLENTTIDATVIRNTSLPR